MRYDSNLDAENIISKECDPFVYNILVTTHDKLPETYRIPMHYDNTRVVVLTTDDGTSERQFFDYFGDLFWLYADSKVQGIESYLLSLTNMKRLDSEGFSTKDLLFYTKDQMHFLYFFDYLGYFKVQYVDSIDLENKMSVLKPKSGPKVKFFIAKDVQGGIQIESI